MAEIKNSECFSPGHLSEVEKKQQFLEQAIRILGCKLRKACDEDDQHAIEKITDMRNKALRLLSNMLTGRLIFRTGRLIY